MKTNIPCIFNMSDNEALQFLQFSIINNNIFIRYTLAYKNIKTSLGEYPSSEGDLTIKDNYSFTVDKVTDIFNIFKEFGIRPYMSYESGENETDAYFWAKTTYKKLRQFTMIEGI